MKNKYHHILGPGKKVALLISDMQKAYTQGIFDADFNQDKEIQVIKKLLKVAKQNMITTIFTMIAFTDYEIEHPNIWLQKIPELARIKTNSLESEIDPRFSEYINSSNIIVKKHTSSFFGTQLANQLYSEGIDTIIVTGCTTSGCVRATTVEGLENGFRMLVVKDAVADRWQESHNQSLFEINAKYGDVIDSALAIEIITNINSIF